MKVYPKLEKFLTNLAYCAIVEPQIADVCAAAGIDWAQPKTFPGDCVIEFVGHRETLGTEKALAKMRSVIGILECQIENLAGLPGDIESIRLEYRELSKVQRAIDVANLVLKDPEGHEKYSAMLDASSANRAVATTDLDGLIASYGVALAKIRMGEGQVTIGGFERVSDLVGGFNHGRVTFVLAESGFGKSNLALNLAFAATKKMAVAYLNLELTYEDMSKRVAVLRSNKTWSDLKDGKIEVSDMSGKLKNEIRMSDGSELHVESMIAWARAYKRENPKFGLLVIDYDQKIELDTGRETPEWRAMQVAVRRLEDEAKKIGYHVILVAQLNREGKISSSHRAVFTAHTVLTFRQYQGGPIIENSIKHRHAKGPCGVRVKYNDTSCLVTELEEDIFYLRDESAIENEKSVTKKKAAVNKFEEMMRGKND